jgi:hypothetical protein
MQVILAIAQTIIIAAIFKCLIDKMQFAIQTVAKQASNTLEQVNHFVDDLGTVAFHATNLITDTNKAVAKASEQITPLVKESRVYIHESRVRRSSSAMPAISQRDLKELREASPPLPENKIFCCFSPMEPDKSI